MWGRPETKADLAERITALEIENDQLRGKAPIAKLTPSENERLVGESFAAVDLEEFRVALRTLTKRVQQLELAQKPELLGLTPDMGGQLNRAMARIEALEKRPTAPAKSDPLPPADKDYVARIIKDAEQHRNQAMYDRVQWQTAEIQQLQEQLRLHMIREERVRDGIAMLEKQFDCAISTDSQGNIKIALASGAEKMLPTGYTVHLNGGKQLGK